MMKDTNLTNFKGIKFLALFSEQYTQLLKDNSENLEEIRRQQETEKKLKSYYGIEEVMSVHSPEWIGIRNRTHNTPIQSSIGMAAAYDAFDIHFDDGARLQMGHDMNDGNGGFNSSKLIYYHIFYYRSPNATEREEKDNSYTRRVTIYDRGINFDTGVSERDVFYEGKNSLKELSHKMSRAYTFIHQAREESLTNENYFEYYRIASLVEVGMYIVSRLSGTKVNQSLNKKSH